MNSVPDPGLRQQAGLRTTFRITGPVVLVGGLTLMAVALVDFFTAELMPTEFWLFFVAVPLVGLGGWLTQAGYVGVAVRYASGELAPVARDTAAYLSDGRGIGAVGPRVDHATRPWGGPSCRACGVGNDTDARFCDDCGRSLA
jgi:hypothetical protein